MASRADVALYIVLCSLTVLDRRELKSTVLDRPNISALLESDTQSRELLESFYACEYKKTLRMLEKMKNRICLDIHLANHYTTLVEAITRRALRQFVQPYDSLRIERLAASMGWDGIQGQQRAVNELIGLIQKGDIHGKLDVIDKVRLIYWLK
jgi:COP9 signalosome complex subunit 1